MHKMQYSFLYYQSGLKIQNLGFAHITTYLRLLISNILILSHIWLAYMCYFCCRNQQNNLQMTKTTLLLLFFFILAIKSNSLLKLKSSYELSQSTPIRIDSIPSTGNIVYKAVDLPPGVILINNQIIIQNTNKAINGYYPVRIQATDESGQSDQKIIVIFVNKTNQQINASTQSRQNLQGNFEDADPAGLPSQTEYFPEQISGILQSTSNYISSQDALKYENSLVAPAISPGNDDTKVILNQQAIPSIGNRNTISPEGVRNRAIFERQFNAGKVLGNLLAIIRQANANSKAAQEQIAIQKLILQQKLKDQQSIALKIAEADSSLSRIQAGINLLNTGLSQYKKNSKQLINQLTVKKLDKQALEKAITTSINLLSQKNTQLNKTKLELEEKAIEYAYTQLQCKTLQKEILINQEELKTRPKLKQKLTQSLTTNQNKIGSYKALIVSLKIEIERAEKQLNAAENENKQLQKNILNFDQITRIYEQRLAALQQNQFSCLASIERMMQQISVIKEQTLPSIQTSIFMIQVQLEKLNKNLQQINARLKEIPLKYEDSQRQIKIIQERLKYLSDQYLVASNNLSLLYEKGNQAAQAVFSARENLETAISRFEKQQQIIQEATLNLEKARIQKQKADEAVDALLRQEALILPYAIDNSNTAQTENIKKGPKQIESWDAYIQQTFGSQINGLYSGQVNNLYTWSFQAQNKNLQAQASCPTDNLSSISGFIMSTLNRTIIMINGDDGIQYQIQTNDCTIKLSNRDGYSPQSGDIIIVKGKLLNQTFQAVEIACIRQ